MFLFLVAYCLLATKRRVTLRFEYRHEVLKNQVSFERVAHAGVEV
jgi:hypothetical protein